MKLKYPIQYENLIDQIRDTEPQTTVNISIVTIDRDGIVISIDQAVEQYEAMICNSILFVVPIGVALRSIACGEVLRWHDGAWCDQTGARVVECAQPQREHA